MESKESITQGGLVYDPEIGFLFPGFSDFITKQKEKMKLN